MNKPIYYVHKHVDQSYEEIEKKIQMFQAAGFRVITISDGEESDISSCLKKMIDTHLH